MSIVHVKYVSTPALVRRPLRHTLISPRLRAGGVHCMSFCSCDFEVHGLVQGVFFRACMADKANQLDLVGRVRNTPAGTVQGTIQGDPGKVAAMKEWLANVGSPASRIERCDFTNERTGLSSVAYTEFEVERRRQ